MDADLDEIDREILRLLQENARTPFSEIARTIEMSSATVHDRVSRLEATGVIEGYHARVNPKALGWGISAIVGMRVDQGQETETLKQLQELDNVREIHLTTGQWDVILRVYATDADALRKLMFTDIAEIDGFDRTQTMVILGTEYENEQLPVPDADA